ncbi:hypothetical protein ABBQ38_000178 [Trebouxia sp. C0009 RCD-2024]
MTLACSSDRIVARAGQRATFWQQRRVYAKASARATKYAARTALTGRVTASQATERTHVQKASSTSLRLSVAAHEIPHPAKASYGGEDAFFISQQGSTSFGVADGVGGWANSGINPAEYSKSLMREAKAHFEGTAEAATLAEPPAAPSTSSETSNAASTASEAAPRAAGSGELHLASRDAFGSGVSASQPADATGNSPTTMPQIGRDADDLAAAPRSPRTALAAAHKATKQPGSSTALVLQFPEGSNTIKASNLGDSGFALFRNKELIFQSSPLQHFFDCPYQFAACPDFTDDTDRAEDAVNYELELQSGDVIVAATDGLWDNLHTEELLPLLPASEDAVQEAAHQIAAAASSNAYNEQYPSPYTVQALRQGMDLPWWQKLAGIRFKDGKLQLAQLTGGKLDDITVVVAFAAAA